MRQFSSRVFPRPSDAVTGVTAAAPSDRQVIDVGFRTSRVHGGSIQRVTAGGGTETEVTLSLYRSSGDESCDFIDSQTLTLEPGGDPGEAQASFAFDPPLEVSSDAMGFWWTVQNATAVDEDYAIAFDVEACTDTSAGSA